jgi:integrase
MPNRVVSIYERVNGNRKPTWRAVEIPELKKDGGLYLKDNITGQFYISWYDGTDSKGRPRKCWEKVKGLSRKEGVHLSQALTAKGAKEWELEHPERVKEEAPENSRPTIDAGAYRYLQQLAGHNLTLKEHRHALEEFQNWFGGRKYVDQITRADLLSFKSYLERTKENSEITAVWKIIRVNKFYKWALNKKPGDGLVKTTEFKDVLRRKPKVEVYGPEELKKFFAACNPVQFVLFQLYYKCGLRNKELAHLEWTDIDIKRRELDIRRKRLQNGDEKKAWAPKHGSEGVIVFPASLVPLLEDLKKEAKCNLVFPTRNRRVNIKLLDQCKLVAGRAGLDEAKCKIKSFRATFATNRLRSGYDLATVREQLRHRDLKSIEHYLDYVKNEELIATGKVDSGWDV